MPVKQGSLELLEHAAAKELLQSKIPARLAYIGTDGTPRVVPIWFHWTGKVFVMGTPPKAPKLKALGKNPKVALTIDDNNFPHKVLLVRGTATLETVAGWCRSMLRQPNVISEARREKRGSNSWAARARRWSASVSSQNGWDCWTSRRVSRARCRLDGESEDRKSAVFVV